MTVPLLIHMARRHETLTNGIVSNLRFRLIVQFEIGFVEHKACIE